MTIVIVSCIVNSLQLSIVIVILPLSLSSSNKAQALKAHNLGIFYLKVVVNRKLLKSMHGLAILVLYIKYSIQSQLC